jgi:glycosyltransferase involved in cell wall biosynthesis
LVIKYSMNIVINTTILNKGGGLQVAISVIKELNKLNLHHKFLILASPHVFNQLHGSVWSKNFDIQLIKISPAKIFTRKRTINNLNKLIDLFDCHVVLTVFGPSYWTPKVRHISGFADGWCLNSKSIALNELSLVDKIKRRLLTIYKLYYLKKNTDIFYTETEDSKVKLCEILNLNEDSAFVISNTFSDLFNNVPRGEKLIQKPRGLRFFVPAANYPSKNIKILNQVIPLLKNKITEFQFVLTVPHDELNNLILPENRSHIINLGFLSVSDFSRVYNEIDYVFLPTLLETFTAVYPESMKMNKPILTSDLSFAKDICREAALYFDPLNPVDIVEKILIIVHNPKLVKELIEEGKNRLNDFPTSKQRAEQLLSICLNQ